MENTLMIKKAIKGNKEAFTTLIHQDKKELYKIAYIYTNKRTYSCRRNSYISEYLENICIKC